MEASISSSSSKIMLSDGTCYDVCIDPVLQSSVTVTVMTVDGTGGKANMTVTIGIIIFHI
jgi:hypothetical protein